ncbi:hypothetical protein LWC34_45440 [Kibdelosporangium philippinense]|uniref:ApeA N-terminal domain-containing protein n=1 Tax=Kibdelosporangium philippinense TaxID=211113 RepID=A0ABS8ZQK1_9PSEU|nr:hypothetical protein [Kibdelosporangium philippinense]MCE7010004.1 hypothetical protein [Kibdelosporangium philippinense]
MAVFGPDSPVLLPKHVDYAGPQRWVLWPTMRYRVVSPMMRDPELNVFQSAVLGLSRSGLRSSLEIAGLLKLQPDLVDLVVSDLKAYQYLDRHGGVTLAGRAALRDGFVDPTSNVVTYVFQDLFTGSLLPIATSTPTWVRSSWQSARTVRLNLRTTGSPLTKNAFCVDLAGAGDVAPPEAEQILDAVARSSSSGRDRGRRRRAGVIPDRVVSRVSLVGSGDATYVPLVLRLERRRDDTVDTVSWSACNTMTGQPSNYLRRLIATRMQHSEPLRLRIESFVGRRSDALLQDYDRMDVDLRRQFAETLEARFTVRIREYPVLVELLSLMERDLQRTKLPGDHQAEINSVVHRAWQAHETILRDIVVRHPAPASCLDGQREPLTAFLGNCCRQLRMPFSEQTPIRKAELSSLKKNLDRLQHPNTPVLLALCVLSAVHGAADHPVRRLAQAHPHLLTELTTLSGDRNDVAHSPVKLNHEYAESASRLTQDTVAAFLGRPLQATTTKEPSVVP